MVVQRTETIYNTRAWSGYWYQRICLICLHGTQCNTMVCTDINYNTIVWSGTKWSTIFWGRLQFVFLSLGPAPNVILCLGTFLL